jgi:membrane protein YqaA with SNARE-associated domain
VRGSGRVISVVTAGILLLVLATSFASAVVPLGPPEVLVVTLVASGTASPQLGLGVAAAAAVGQVAGKLLVFLSVRGSLLRRNRFMDRIVRRRLLDRLALSAGTHPRQMAAVVAVSALTSIPRSPLSPRSPGRPPSARACSR